MGFLGVGRHHARDSATRSRIQTPESQLNPEELIHVKHGDNPIARTL